MGNDGGSIPKRTDLVKTARKQPKADVRIQEVQQWHFCALSKRPLVEPVVADRLGRLYRRDTILEHLLDSDKYGDADQVCPHIRSLKDVVSLNLTPNPLADTISDVPAGSDVVTPTPLFLCPVTRREMAGRPRFVFAPVCGCVVSEEAVKQMADVAECLVCGKPVAQDDYIPLNPLAEELPRLKERMLAAMASRRTKRRTKVNAEGPSKKARHGESHISSEAKAILARHDAAEQGKARPAILAQVFGSTSSM